MLIASAPRVCGRAVSARPTAAPSAVRSSWFGLPLCVVPSPSPPPPPPPDITRLARSGASQGATAWRSLGFGDERRRISSREQPACSTASYRRADAGADPVRALPPARQGLLHLQTEGMPQAASCQRPTFWARRRLSRRTAASAPPQPRNHAPSSRRSRHPLWVRREQHRLMRKATRRHPIHAGTFRVSRLVLPHPRDSRVHGVQSAAVYNYISEPQTAKPTTERSKRCQVLPPSRAHRRVDSILSAHVTFSKPPGARSCSGAPRRRPVVV
jgi:hypothetical protein